jgi:type II secretory pathway predicted ATPase ExeA
MLRLHEIVRRLGARQVELARHLGISKAAVTQWLAHGQWPRRQDPEGLRQAVSAWLAARGATPAERAGWAETVPGAAAAAPVNEEDTAMLLRHTALTAAARNRFQLFRDPFHGEVASHEDLYLTPDARYVREALWQAARHAGFVAVVGESGSGKSMLRRDLHDRIAREGEPVIIIEPYVLGMEDSDKRGQTLRAAHIAESVVATLAPLERPMRSPEARFRQVHRLLRESHRAGHRHLLVIEEAHCLPLATLKHLKRFLELEDGFARLLGVVLLGQSELAWRLSETDPAVREVVQRCEVVTLAPLDARLPEYLRHKLTRVGKTLDEIMDERAVEALRERLTVVPRGKGQSPVSLVYPLAAGNLVTAAINLAAEIGAPRVTADLVREL